MSVSGKVFENLEGVKRKRECIRRSIVSVQDEWRTYTEHLEAAQKNLVEEFAELEAKKRDLGLAQKSVSERSKELDLIRESLDERLKRAGEEEKAFCAMHGRFMQELELKFKELHLIAKNYAKEVECREEKLRELAQLAGGIFYKIDLEKKEMERIKELVEEKILQMDLKEMHNQRENEFWLTWIMKRQNEKNAVERELNEQENVPKGKLKEPVNDVASKKKKLLEERELEIELQEHALETLREELELKEKEADFIKELSKKHVKELDFREKELDSREKQIESLKKFIQNCFKDYLSKKKECKLEKELLERESKNLEERRIKLEDRIKEVELREKELDLIEKQCNDFLAARLNAGIIGNVVDNGGVNVSYADLRFVVTMDGKGLQMFLNERTNHLDTMAEEVFKALHLSLDPAKLVLDAMEGFYPPHLKKGNMEFDATVVRRSCIVILEQLAKISPNIQPRVRDEAIKIATQWKAKLMTANVLEVLGFLQLLASYKLASAFDAEEIMILLGSVAQYQRTIELCRCLGFSGRAQDIIQILLRNAHYIEAVNFVYAFELVDRFPPVPILKNYLEHIEETANGLLKKDLKSQKAQKEAMDQKVAAMRAVIKCIMDHKLESEYSPRTLEECINQLQAQKERNGFIAPESQHMPKRQSKVEVSQILPEGAIVPSKALSVAPNSSKTNTNPPQPMTVILANMQGKELLYFLKEHIDELGLLCYHVSSALKFSNDSAELVLDAIKGLYNSMHKEETEDEAIRKWRSCILLLKQLMMIPLDIREEIKEEARKLAVDLKERIQSGTRNPVVVFGFLLFIDIYGVTPCFDTDALLSFYGSGSHDRLLARFCQALRISERISESSLSQCLGEVLRQSLENLVVDNRIDSTSTIPGLDIKSFSDVLDTKEMEHNSISGVIPAFICKASDPASLVLDALLSCYRSMCGKCDSFKLVAKSFFQLLQQLTRVSPEIKPHVRDKATRFSFDWKANWSLHLTGQASSWEALAFLQLIASYKLPSSFSADELHGLQEAAYQPKEAISLFRTLGLVEKMPSFISNLIKNKQWLLALTFICEFKLVDKFSPVPLLKNHIMYAKKLGKKRCAESHNTAEAQNKAILVEISAVNAAIRCIKKYGLETKFPVGGLIDQIAKLRHKMMTLKNSTPTRSSRAEQQQLAAVGEVAPFPSAQLPQEGMKKRSALAAGIIQTTQPLPALSARIVQGTQPLQTKCARLH